MKPHETEDAERKLIHALAQADREIAQGVGHTLDEVLADADTLLERETPADSPDAGA